MLQKWHTTTPWTGQHTWPCLLGVAPCNPLCLGLSSNRKGWKPTSSLRPTGRHTTGCAAPHPALPLASALTTWAGSPLAHPLCSWGWGEILCGAAVRLPPGRLRRHRCRHRAPAAQEPRLLRRHVLPPGDWGWRAGAFCMQRPVCPCAAGVMPDCPIRQCPCTPLQAQACAVQAAPLLHATMLRWDCRCTTPGCSATMPAAMTGPRLTSGIKWPGVSDLLDCPRVSDLLPRALMH